MPTTRVKSLADGLRTAILDPLHETGHYRARTPMNPVMHAPPLLSMLQSLIKTPSVSCTSAALDQSNLAVINELATWLESLGFKTTVRPLTNVPGKANLIATLGTGTADWCRRAYRHGSVRRDGRKAHLR